MATRLLGLKGTLALAGLCAAWAATGFTARAFPNPNKPKLAAVYAPIIQELQQTRQLLQVANRDYGGHRVRASAEVHKAIEILAHGFHKPNPTKKPVVVVAPGVVAPVVVQKLPPAPEAQGVSDAQMLQAAKQLAAVITQLSNSPPTKRSVAAVPLLQQAIVQIEQGLAVVRRVPPGAVLVK